MPNHDETSPESTSPTSSPYLIDNDVNNSALRLRARQLMYNNDMRLKRFLTYDAINYLYLPENFSTSFVANKMQAEEMIKSRINKIKMLNLPPANNNIRIFVKMRGVLANVSIAMAKALDNWTYDVPQTGLLMADWFEQFFAYELMSDLCNGPEFWRDVHCYPWAWMLFERMCKICNSNIYFLNEGDRLDGSTWGYSAEWIHKHFGNFGINHYIMAANNENLNLLCHKQTDVLITSCEEHSLVWRAHGGTTLYFPEIDERSTRAADEAANRLIVLNVLGHLLKSEMPVV